MTTLKQRDELKKEQRAKVRRWPKRLAKLKKRENDPLSEAEFCDKYGIAKAQFNRAKNQAVEPRASKVAIVEAAFEAEGV